MQFIIIITIKNLVEKKYCVVFPKINNEENFYEYIKNNSCLKILKILYMA